MKETTYTDQEGRKWWVLLPDDTPESEAYRGIPLGPPSVESLGLPQDIATRLHNELYARRFFTREDALRHQTDIASAIRAALRVSVDSVIALY